MNHEIISAAQLQFIDNQKKKKKWIHIIRIVILVVFFAQWEITARTGLVDSFLFSSPSKVVKTVMDLSQGGAIWYHTGITLLETLTSFLFVCVLTIGIGVLLWYSEKASKVLEPYMVVLNSIPKSALAPLFIVWFGANKKTIIITGVTLAIFGSVLSIYTSFMNIEEDKYKLVYTLGGTRIQVLTKIILPSTIPMMINLMKVNIGLCLVGVIIGEFMAAKSGLGYLIIYGSQTFKMSWVISSIMILCVIAILFYQGIGLLEKRILKNFL